MSSLSNPSPRTRHGTPVSTDEYQGWFDSDGRLVKESIMRQTLFEGEYVCVCTTVTLIMFYKAQLANFQPVRH